MKLVTSYNQIYTISEKTPFSHYCLIRMRTFCYRFVWYIESLQLRIFIGASLYTFSLSISKNCEVHSLLKSYNRGLSITIIGLDPYINVDHPTLTVWNIMGNYIGLKTRTLVKVRNEKLIFLFLNQNICCGHIKSYNIYMYIYISVLQAPAGNAFIFGTWLLRRKFTKPRSDNTTKEVQLPSSWSYKTLVHGYASVLMSLVINHLHANCLLWLQNINGSNMSLIRLFSRTILISILPKNHADGDKWLVTEINNFTSI